MQVAPPLYVQVHSTLVKQNSQLPRSSSHAAKHLPRGSTSALAVASPSFFSFAHVHASSERGSDAVEAFLSAWTRLVGDPVLSKWIVCCLLASLALNAYLVKGIGVASAFRVVGVGAGSVRFSASSMREERAPAEKSDDEDEKVKEEEKEEKNVLPERKGLTRRRPSSIKINGDVRSSTEEAVQTSEIRFQPPYSGGDAGLETRLLRPKPMRASSILPDTATMVNSLALELVDKRLELEQARAGQDEKQLDKVNVRSLAECVDIFENGPRPVSDSLALLNDEEVVLLSQDGKIQAYALEKMLGNFERAVRIRRILICELICPSLFISGDLLNSTFQLVHLVHGHLSIQISQ